jgi:hypothetical protein
MFTFELKVGPRIFGAEERPSPLNSSARTRAERVALAVRPSTTQGNKGQVLLGAVSVEHRLVLDVICKQRPEGLDPHRHVLGSTVAG